MPQGLTDRHFAIKVFATQALLSSLIPLLTLLAANKMVALAALCGGWIATISNGYFIIQAFRYSGARASSQMIRAIYRGEAGKFVIAAVLFIVAFKNLESAREHALTLILTYTAVHCSTWFVPNLVGKTDRR